MRSNIYTIKFSSNPADMGYDGRPTDWDGVKADKRGTASTCLDAYHEWRRMIGQSTYTTYRVYHKGKLVDRDEFEAEAHDQERGGFGVEFVA